MHLKGDHGSSILVALVVLSALVAACRTGSPGVSESPVQTVASPLEEPTVQPTTAPTTTPVPQTPKKTPAPADPKRTPVAIVDVVIEPDREVITLENVSDTEQDISKWTLFNREREPLFVFPDGVVLQAGESVRVYSAVPEDEVPENAYFWTEEKVWLEFPANVMLLNREMRLVYWHTEQNP